MYVPCGQHTGDRHLPVRTGSLLQLCGQEPPRLTKFAGSHQHCLTQTNISRR